MNLLMPCAGNSSRFHTRLPKFLLSMPDNTLMFRKSIEPFLKFARRICFAVLKEHDEKYHAVHVIKSVLPDAEVLVLDGVTRGQAETVKLMLERLQVSGAFLVKDSDSYFVPKQPYDPENNYVSVCSAREEKSVKLYNKSFAVMNEQGYIVGTVEKEISSQYFSCGGYFFSDAGAYLTTFRGYDRMHTGGEFYLSNIIDLMIEEGHIFRPMFCRDYEDWGTHEDWIAYRQRFATYVFDLDGVIYKNGSQYWSPTWGENTVIEAAKEKVNQLYRAGHYILLVTSRPERFREVTETQLRRDGVDYHQLVMAVHHGKRVLVNDFGPTNPYPSAVAINTGRDSADFGSKI